MSFPQMQGKSSLGFNELELIFEGNICLLHKLLPTTSFSKVQVHSTRWLEIESALKKKIKNHMWMQRFHESYVMGSYANTMNL